MQQLKCIYFFFLLAIGSFFPSYSLAATPPTGNNGGQESKNIIIRLKDQFNIVQQRTKLAGLSGEMRKEVMIDGMKIFCKQSQDRFLGTLKANQLISKIGNINTFWITNAIICKATDDVIAQLKEYPEVESVTLDIPQKIIDDVQPLAITSNPEIAENIQLVRALDANAYGYTGKGIVIAIIDSGVNYNHEDIKDNLWTSDEYPNHGWDFSNNDDDPMDDNGHGTHCAGTILGTGKAGIRTGVAPDAKLMILKTMNAKGSGTQEATWKSIEFAIENKANVISMSAGWTHSNNPDEKSWRDIMVNLLEYNILFVVAAGNEGQFGTLPTPWNVRVPGNCPAAWLHPDQPNQSGISSVLTVGSTKKNGITISAFSSKGPVTWQHVNSYNDYPFNPGSGLIKPDIAAPGDTIISLDYTKINGYVQMSGTSMATPCVSGIVASMLSKNPSLTPTDIVQIISESSVRIADKFNNLSGAGRVDALFATLNTPNEDINCSSYILKETKGYANGLFNAGDEAVIDLSFENKSAEKFEGYTLDLISYTPGITVTRKSDNPVTIASNTITTLTDMFAIKISDDIIANSDVLFAVILRKDEQVRTNMLRSFIAKTELTTGEMNIKEAVGNNNGRPDNGEEIILTFPIQNTGSETSKAVQASISWESPYLTLLTPDMGTTDIETTHQFTAHIKISKDTPDWYSTSINLKLKGDNIEKTFNYNLHIGKTALLIVDRSKKGESAKAFETVIAGDKNLSYISTTELPESLDNYQSVWFFTGVYPNNRKVTEDEKKIISKYLENGGYVYIEGGDVWYDKKVPMKDLFHINFIADNGGKLDSIFGCRKYVNEDEQYKYTYAHISIDNISPIAPAQAFYKNSNPEYITTVAYNEGAERTIGSSFELGGIINGTTSVAVDRYLEFFGFTPEKKLETQTIYYQCDFEKDMPKDLSLYDLDKQEFYSTMTQYGFKEGDSWIRKQIEGNYFAASTSKYKVEAEQEAKPANDWLITPAIEIKAADAVLSWRAMAICESSKIGDGYKVMISTKGNTPEDFTEPPLFTIAAESRNEWTSHELKLNDFADKTIYIAFVNNSTNCEVLAIDDIAVEGGKGFCEFLVKTEEHVFGANEVDIKCNITPYSDVPVTEFTAYCKSGEKTLTKKITELQLDKYESFDFSFDEPLSITYSDTLHYQVWVEINGKKTAPIEKEVVSFTFKPFRRIVVEEGIGMSYGFCPKGIVALDILKEKYPKEVIPIAVHYDDIITVDNYVNNIKFPGFPSGFFNRKDFCNDPMKLVAINDKQKYTSLEGGFETYFLNSREEVAIADINLQTEYSNGKINAKVNLHFAIDIKEANYQIAFVMTENSVTGTGYYQENYLSDSKIEMGGFEKLPKKIEDYVFEDVARVILDSYHGIPGSVPQEIEANSEHVFEYQFDVPNNVLNIANTKVIALLINSQTGEILNADKIAMGPIVGIHDITKNNYDLSCYRIGDDCIINLKVDDETKAIINMYTIDGVRVASVEKSIYGATSVSIPVNGKVGVHFITIDLPDLKKTVTRKVML